MVPSARKIFVVLWLACLPLVVAARRTEVRDYVPAGILNALDKVWPRNATDPGDLPKAVADGLSRPGADRTVPDYAPAGRIDPISPTASLPQAPAVAAPTPLEKMQAAADLYAKGDLVGGDELAKGVYDPIQSLALAWIALKSSAQPDYNRLAAFAAAHPKWPGNEWIRQEQETALYARPFSDEIVAALFSDEEPLTPLGKLALARAERDAGRVAQATAIIRALWRNEPLNGSTESALLRDFGPLLTKADHKFRADKLLYADHSAAALRAAALAGPDVLALAEARASALHTPLRQALVDRVPVALKGDPGLLFQRIRTLRRADRALEAAALLATAPRDPSVLIDGDRWWGEQRLIARRLIDLGDVKQAYALCARNSTVPEPMRTEAEFLCGWVALRFLDRAEIAARHFALAALNAKTPWSISRVAYWQGRAAKVLKRTEEAQSDFSRAAAFPIAYYGQLAAQELNRPNVALRAPQTVATGEARDEAIRVVELLYAVGLDTLASSLAIDIARTSIDDAQVAALGRVVIHQGDAHASVAVGKRAIERGFALDEVAFPNYGIPSYTAMNRSADVALVYAVARQESEFDSKAASGAGAKGLMQLMPATAQDTARRAGLSFDADRLINDPAFNAQIGAAYLGQLLNDEAGSVLLAFAAYNAGSARVQQWISAYGDPRTNVDPVDWVERIPFDETREYLQRVSENLSVYRAILAANGGLGTKVARAGGP